MTCELPNILLITTHDLGTYMGCYGWDSALRTPHLDRVAREGVRFENQFCTAPYCSPSRGSIMSGKYPHKNGLMGLVNLGWDMPLDNELLPTLLGEGGYETFLFGFQHIASDVSGIGYDCVSERGNYGCDAVAPLAAQFLKKRSGSAKKPFYAKVGFSEVHRPYRVSRAPEVDEGTIRPLPFLEDTPGLRKDMAMFYGVIQRMDRAVGHVLDALESAELSDNTVVVFTTDHGIAFPRAKATLYDPGIRTALLMRWPGMVEEDRVVDELISNVDLLPTLLDITGVPVPSDLDGRSFWPLLQGESYEPREAVFAEKNTSPDDIKRCVRTPRYKYIRNCNTGPRLELPTDIEVTATRGDMGEEHLKPRPPVELYDLETDPWEKNNLAGDDDYDSVEEQMQKRLKRILRETDDPIQNGASKRPEEEEEHFERIWTEEAMQGRKERERSIQEEYEELKSDHS
ncbi:MAG: sulfatase [Planctomycetes bacterium]|nr:sulfatase [Planctomycetota bacterium]